LQRLRTTPKMEQSPVSKGTSGLKVATKPSQGSACPKSEMHLTMGGKERAGDALDLPLDPFCVTSTTNTKSWSRCQDGYSPITLTHPFHSGVKIQIIPPRTEYVKKGARNSFRKNCIRSRPDLHQTSTSLWYHTSTVILSNKIKEMGKRQTNWQH